MSMEMASVGGGASCAARPRPAADGDRDAGAVAAAAKADGAAKAGDGDHDGDDGGSAVITPSSASRDAMLTNRLQALSDSQEATAASARTALAQDAYGMVRQMLG